MRIIATRNPHEALSLGLKLLRDEGIQRDSRNGPVLLAPCPVTSVYSHPRERVVFWAERDANVAFHLFESLHMIAGRNDIASLARYAKNMLNYSDDGSTQHANYGHRWRKAFGMDQLEIVARRLREDPTDRRSVLQMWDCRIDLDKKGLDFPCNLIAVPQVNSFGELDLTVFQRSADAIWGVYGANAVHLTFMQEYLSIWIGCSLGKFYHTSVNFHAYLNTFKPLEDLPLSDYNPYENGLLALPLTEPRPGETPNDTIKRLDEYIKLLLFHADTGFTLPRLFNDDEPWVDVVYAVLKAHELWRTLAAPERFEEPLRVLAAQPQTVDWVVSMREWVERRKAIWENKQLVNKVAD